MLSGGAIAALQQFFANPVRRAFGYAGLGVVGLLLGGAGILLATGGGDKGAPVPAAVASESPSVVATATPTRTATPAPSRTPGPSPTPTPSPSPTPGVTRVPQAAAPQEPTATPVPPTPTTAPIVAGGPYCPSISPTAPPTRIYGLVTIAGAPAPAGTVVSLAFDGVVGPSTVVIVENGRAGYAIDFAAGSSECANRRDALIQVVVDGRYFATGGVVGFTETGSLRFDIEG